MDIDLGPLPRVKDYDVDYQKASHELHGCAIEIKKKYGLTRIQYVGIILDLAQSIFGTYFTKPDRKAAPHSRRGFTLIELLVVIVIVLIISAVALPIVIPLTRHRQVSEAARALQGALTGARDEAIHQNTPTGIRLIPDPAFPLIYLPNGQIDPSQPLAYNRIIPIAAAPNYTTGLITPVDTTALPQGFTMPYPALMVSEVPVSVTAAGTTLNEPTSWFWNIRVGDKLQFNQAGPWYTVVGPMFVGPAQGNSEQFVNVGPAGTKSPYQAQFGTLTLNPEFLWLVNGKDDNGNGWKDEGFDGVDNNGNGVIDELAEWEVESWN